MNAVAIIATLAVTFQAAGAGLLRGAGQALADQFMPRTARAVMPADPSLPDIFVVLLDGYPRADILETVFGFDNSPFLRALEGRGFAVSVRSHANYMSTNLTLASMFDMRPLSEIDGLELSPTDEVQNDRTLHAVLNGARGLTSLRQVGYRVETVSTGLEFATLREADQSIESSGLSLLELRLLTDSGMSLVLDAVNPAWVLQQHRDRVEAAFAEVRPRSRESQGPTFRLVHILSPHPPIVLGDDLDLTSIEYTLSGPARDDPVAMRRFVHQVRAANDLTLAATDRLRSDDRPPVIIVMSDHGTETAGRTGRWMFKDPGERVANLFAASTPGVGRLFGPAMTPVNLLPILLNHYAGLELQTWPDESYRWTGNEFERMGEGDSETS